MAPALSGSYAIMGFMKNIAIIGGGAAGLAAAVASARAGAQVTIFEAADRVGKTILAT
ncbi:MAG: NAD(P)-binding protein, partial [Raoultibacter sp.]